MSAKEDFYKSKAREQELRNAQEISDQILRVIGMKSSPMMIDGMKEAHEEIGRLLDEWGREEVEKNG